MAKGKKKPASEPKVKKTEPILKDEAIPVEDTQAPKEEEVIEEIIVKAEKPKKKKEKKAKKEEKKSLHSFPEKENCKHTNTKRTLGRGSRVLHVCTECGAMVRFGGR